jgi:phosphate transport system permease protein
MTDENQTQESASFFRDVEIESPFIDNIDRRRVYARIFNVLIAAATVVAMLILAILIYRICAQGLPWLTWDFMTSFPSRMPSRAGILSALVGSASIIVMTTMIAVFLGVGAAVYLEELAPRTNKLSRFIEVNIANLSGVPSLVYGMLGLAVFVRIFGFGRSILAAACTLAMMILPTIIIASREALRTVPTGIRTAALALGATNWQTTWHHVLPAASPGILTGIILAISRALGEAAPLIMVGGVTYIAFLPSSAMDSFTTLPIQIFNWAGRPQEDFQSIAAAAIIVLVGLVLITNGLAILLRAKLENRNRW